MFEAAIGAHLSRIPDAELYYWREGQCEVDYVLVVNEDVYAIEVKSGRRKREQGLLAFKKNFPNAKTFFLDWQSGQAFLAAMPKMPT